MKKKKVVVASQNPVKLEVARLAFEAVFPGVPFDIVGVKAPSGVPDQPMNDETRQGARNRLAAIRKAHPDADYWMSHEGGIFEDDGRLANRAWLAACDASGFIAESSTSHFYLPTEVAGYIRQGIELGDANDKFFSTKNSKHGIGAVGHQTDGLIDRVHYYLQPAIVILSEIKHKEWYT